LLRGDLLASDGAIGVLCKPMLTGVHGTELPQFILAILYEAAASRFAQFSHEWAVGFQPQTFNRRHERHSRKRL
jgi:hypothetical protein